MSHGIFSGFLLGFPIGFQQGISWLGHSASKGLSGLATPEEELGGMGAGTGTPGGGTFIRPSWA